ncbi:Peptidase MA superfamily [Micromonospora nigra]|uniref:Peptidase MA superfamily n=1 Tax=Micromonospora nigra TaxID=145857 RepID=A0A1C6RTC1_9ACTN|nr:Peptidase MA superfamily [Micromonospora nigra]
MPSPAADPEPVATVDPEPPSPVAAPGPDRRPRHRWPLWASLVAVSLLLTLGLPAALSAGGSGVATLARAAAAPENPTTVAARQLAERISGQLERQSAALLAGDREGFLAIAAPAARADLRQRFAALRALRVSAWQARPHGLPTPTSRAGDWRLVVEFRYCFVVPGCRTSPLLVNTRWREGTAAPRLLALAVSEPDAQVNGWAHSQYAALPWEVSELVAAVGERTIVATTPALRDRLPNLLRRAEAAATVADAYAMGDAPPDRYRIFYAGPREWKRWYGGEQPSWSAGYAVPVGGDRHEVVVRADSHSGADLEKLLRHELTHVASLTEHGPTGASAWWLVEGLAELAEADGEPADRHPRMAEVRRLVGRGWKGPLDRIAPDHDTADWRVSAAYGVSYLTVRCLADRFGEQRLFAFAKAVLHERRIPRQTAEEILGEPWSVVQDDCVAYVRRLAG